MSKNILKTKSYLFAIEIVKLSQRLQKDNKEFILSRQIMRSGTAIGALIREAEFAESKADFKHKMYISLKEANETKYWLSLLKDTGFIDEKGYSNLFNISKELVAMLVSTIKTLKKS
ncbi:MAG: four helix bundle protein [Bacteroidetes bacterium]|nr:MAG: four helix bundle protein [Bacteroidota bacterium]